MHIEISGIFDDSPRNGGIAPFYLFRELTDQLADLYDAHTAGILKQVI